MILAGDIGGTKTNIALFHQDADQLGKPINQQIFSSKQYDSLDTVIKGYLTAKSAEVNYDCFGIAGPVVDGRVETPNLAWIVDSDKLARAIGVARVNLINELEATFYGIEGLSDQQIYTLNEGALLLKSVSGLYVGGGIAPRIIEKLKDGAFMRAFQDKGRMSSLVASIPVRVILDDKTALYGAARGAFDNRS